MVEARLAKELAWDDAVADIRMTVRRNSSLAAHASSFHHKSSSYCQRKNGLHWSVSDTHSSRTYPDTSAPGQRSARNLGRSTT